jgi:AcrR family transcriptional regulator
VLDAAKTVLVQQGAAHLTLDAVAAKAGVSKGGLLYHFPTKAALVDGLAERLLAFTETNLARAERDGIVRTFLETSLPGGDEADHYLAVFSAVRSGLTVSDETRTLLQHVFAIWSDALRDAVEDPVQADVIRLVGDGLYLGAVLGLQPLDRPALEQVFARLDAPPQARDAGRTRRPR